MQVRKTPKKLCRGNGCTLIASAYAPLTEADYPRFSATPTPSQYHLSSPSPKRFPGFIGTGYRVITTTKLLREAFYTS
jgi:hypothetical protein